MDPMIWHPLPSAGSSGASSPTSQVIRDAPTPCCLDVHLRFPLDVPVPRAPTCSIHGCGGAHAHGLGLLDRLPSRLFSRRQQGLPRSRATSLRACPGLRPRWDIYAGQFSASASPSALLTTSAPTIVKVSGLNTRPARSLCTLHVAGYPTPRNTRFQWGGLPLAGRASKPARLRRRFLCWSTSSRPPSPSFVAH